MSEPFISWEMVKRCMCKLREDQQQMADDIDSLFNLGWPITDIHFAIRGDGKRGSGKVNDPFDGSDPYILEDILNKIHFDNRENVRFKFDKGEYTLFFPYNGTGGIKPSPTWNTLLNGWEFHGAGIGKTIFKCVVDPNNPTLMPIGQSPVIFHRHNNVMHDRLVFKDFTGYGGVNLSNKHENFNLSLISVNCNHLLISDVEVYGMGGNRFESFPIIAYATPATPAEVKCDHIFKRIYAHHNYHHGKGVCILSNGWNSNLSPFVYSNDNQRHLIEECHLEGAYLGTVNCRNAIFRNCYVDCKAGDPEYGDPTLGFTGFNTDTGDNRNIIIEGCTIINARDQFRNSGAIHMGKPSISSPTTIDNVVIKNCRLHVKPSGHVYSGIHFRRGVTNWSISGNTLLIDPADTRPAAGLYLDPQADDVPNGLILEDTGEVYGNMVENLGSNSLPHRWQDDFKNMWTTEYASTGTWPNTTSTAERPLIIFRRSNNRPAVWIERIPSGIISFTNRYGVGRYSFGYRDNSDVYTEVLSANNDTLWRLNAPLSVTTIRTSGLSSNTIDGVLYDAAFGKSSGSGRVAITNGSGSNGRLIFISDPSGTPTYQYIQWDGTTFYLGGLSNGLAITLDGRVRIANPSGYFDAASGVGYRVNNVKVVGDRDTGWTAPTGTGSKAGFTATPADTAAVTYDSTQIQTLMDKVAALEAHNKALYDALAAHGLIGT